MVFVDQRAIPGQLVGAPPGEPQHGSRKEHGVEEPHEDQHHRSGQRQGQHGRSLFALLDRNPRDQHDGKDIQAEDVHQSSRVAAVVENGQQKEDQAAHHRHDQRRADGDRHVIGQRFVESASHGVVVSGWLLVVSCSHAGSQAPAWEPIALERAPGKHWVPKLELGNRGLSRRRRRG